ncbi:DUF1761 domain-containing protein [Demequina sp.]|uniref:DUF1761 domain-containing protein n=1 Tax=Demequina sp. TaxID=2050685 RepID=UPI003D115BCA
MDWLTFEGVNWLAVAIAFIVSFAFGWWYYSPAGVWKVWKRAAGVTDDDVGAGNMGVAFGGTIAANLLGVIVLAMLMAALDADAWLDGLVLGAILGFVYRAGAHALHNGFAMRSPQVTLLDGLHDLVALALAGVILGLF